MFSDSAFHASPAASPVHTAIRDLLMTKVQPRQHGRHKKVTIIGSGAVGLACAYRCVCVASESAGIHSVRYRLAIGFIFGLRCV